MKDYQIKAKTAVGTVKKASGKLEVSKSFRNLQGNLKGKILVCPGEISKSVLEKARALGALGIVTQKIADEELARLKSELKSPWFSSSFILLIVENGLGEILDKLEGKEAEVNVEERYMRVGI